MASLTEIVKQEVFWYAGGGSKVKYLPFANELEQAYTVNVIDTPERRQPAGIVVLAHVVGDYVVIEEDLTDRPLVDRLTAAGVPRDKIILAYAGETVPDVTHR